MQLYISEKLFNFVLRYKNMGLTKVFISVLLALVVFNSVTEGKNAICMLLLFTITQK